MPGRRRATKPPLQALVASAVRLDLRKKPKLGVQTDWQEEAWRQYDISEVLRNAANWQGSSLSRCTIFAADVDADGKPTGPTENQAARDAAYGLLGTPANRSQMLHQIGVHWAVAGDCYVIGETPVDANGEPTGADDEWYVASTAELRYEGSQWKIDGGDGARILNPDHTVIIRMWLSHPRRRWEADSPTRALLPLLKELEQLAQQRAAKLDSRLAGAGLLALSGKISFPPPSQQAMDDNPDADPFVLSLGEAMMTPLQDRSDASSLVPYILRIDGADANGGTMKVADLIAHISFAAELSESDMKAVEAAIRRFAVGFDMPPEALLGMGSANHWGSWQIEESGIKLNIEPKMIVIVSGLNDGYYEAALEENGLPPANFTLWYSTSDLASRPDEGPVAREMHAAGLLSAERAVEASGYSKEDMPSRDEQLRALVVELVKQSPAVLARALFPMLGLPVDGLPEEQPAPPQQTPSERVDDVDGGDRELPEAPGDEGSPAQQASTRTREQLLAAHMLTQRALELAGRRVLTRYLGRRSGAPGAREDVGDIRTVHTRPDVAVQREHLEQLLPNAFDQVPEVAALVGLDPARLETHLRDYVGELLVTGLAHDRSYLSAVVARCQQVPAVAS